MSDREHPYQIACTTNVVGPVGALIGWAENPLHPSQTFRHSWIVLEDCIVEAAPGGVRKNRLDAWTGSGRTVYSDFKLSTSQQKFLDGWAHRQLHKPYDYLADAIVGMDGLWLDLWKRADGDLFRVAEMLEDRARWAWFCSALADAGMTAALQSDSHTGMLAGQPTEVMTDGRPPYGVNPNELGNRMIEIFPAVNAVAA